MPADSSATGETGSTPKGREAGRTSPLEFCGFSVFSVFRRIFFPVLAFFRRRSKSQAEPHRTHAQIPDLGKLILTCRLA
jgi:hypothetical protein